MIDEKLSNRLRIIQSYGGINFFIELPKGYLSTDFYKFILEKGVSVTPGAYFFENITDDRFFRINIANASIADLEKGISIISENLQEFLDNYKIY